MKFAGNPLLETDEGLFDTVQDLFEAMQTLGLVFCYSDSGNEMFCFFALDDEFYTAVELCNFCTF